MHTHTHTCTNNTNTLDLYSPFRVRVRLAFGLKGLKHDVVFMANDDIPTPSALVGKKIAPIFQDQGGIIVYRYMCCNYELSFLFKWNEYEHYSNIFHFIIA